MWFIEFFKKSLEGRGFYPTLMVIVSWTYAAVVVCILLYQLFLYTLGIKYNNDAFGKETSEKKKEQ
ncbi:hypothetical protein [Clostridium coskatii]|uniref:Uncharacterized protein n=1 Tax=Clostridium coskatii TaxID=1705578 RepID=A0A162JB44_9CLOT|nr:hypothetical protein [Clostridium coskatii]OAA92885.1 hypothetical protein WX73_00554 [Clostridium coskatii]OBR95827.1 hypothetical protein CLCOS_12600 [Clostridium coskatii]